MPLSFCITTHRRGPLDVSSVRIVLLQPKDVLKPPEAKISQAKRDLLGVLRSETRAQENAVDHRTL